jgi:hypothetical protein
MTARNNNFRAGSLSLPAKENLGAFISRVDLSVHRWRGRP